MGTCSYKVYLLSVVATVLLEICVFLVRSTAGQYLDKSSDNSFCTCGVSTMQQKFCNSDFVMLGKPTSKRNRVFDWANKPDEAGPYWGKIFTIKVIRPLKGTFNYINKKSKRIKLHFIEGLTCGWGTNSLRLVRHRKYIISGFYHGQSYVVTKCSIFEALTNISDTQAVGLFLKLYERFCNLQRCTVSVVFNSSNPHACVFDPFEESCYSRYAMCTMKNNVCSFKYDYILPVRKRSLRQVPKTIRRRVRKEAKQLRQLLGVNKQRHSLHWSRSQKSRNWNYFKACTRKSYDLERN